MANRITYQVGFNIDKSTLNELKSELASIQKMTTAEYAKGKHTQAGELAKELKQIKQSASEVQNALEKAFNTNLGTLNIVKFNQELKKLEIAKIANDFNKIGVTGQSSFRNMTTQILTTNFQLKETNKILDNIAVTMGNTIKWGASSAVLNSLTGSIEKAWTYTKNLNTSLNDIRIVSNKSADDMERFAVQANNAAKALGASTLDYTKASTIYYQQGLSDEEVAARTDVTLKAANITGQTGSAVSEQLTAIWNGYKVSAQEAELYIDKVAKVAASTAADLEEMATGMSKVASAANSAGVDIDQLNGMLATVISVTREAPETIGTSFRSIFARIGDLALGGEDEYGATLGKVSGQMQELGIQILDQQGEMRKMGDIVGDLAAKWQTWTQAQRQAAAVAIAGKQQYSRLIALMDNWDKYQKAVQDSQGAVGELQREQDIYMESTEAHLQELSTSWERVWKSLSNSKSTNNLIDMFTSLTNGIANFTEAIGGGGNVLLTFGSIFTKIIDKQIAQGIGTLINNFKLAKVTATQLQAELDIINQFKGIKIDDKGTQELIKMKEQILSLGDLVNNEQHNFANAMIKNVNSLQNEEESWNENIKAIEQYLARIREVENVNIKNQDSNGVKLKEDQYKNLTDQSRRALNEQEEQIKKQEKDYRKYEKFLAEINEIMSDNDIKEYAKDLDYLGDIFKEDYSKIEQFQKGLKDLANSSSVSEEQSKKLKNALIDFNKMMAPNEAGGELRWDNYSEALEKLLGIFKNVTNEMKMDWTEAWDTINNETAGKSANLRQKIIDVQKDYQTFIDNIKTVQITKQFVDLASGIGQVASALQSFSNIKNIINNEELSSFEKGLQITIAITSALGMLATGLTTIGGIIPVLVTAFTGLSTQEFIAAQGARAFGSALLTSLTPVLPIIIAIGGAITALVWGIHTLIKTYNEDADATKAARKETEKLKTAYQETKEAADNLKATLNKYTESVKAMDELDHSTTEYKEKLIEANQQALQLLQTNKELYKYISRNEDGLLTISDGGMDAILNKQLQQVSQAQLDYLQQSAKTMRLENTSLITDFVRDRNSKYQGQTNAERYEYVKNNYAQYGGKDDIWDPTRAVKNADGSISTVDSITVEIDGVQKLLSTVVKIGDTWEHIDTSTDEGLNEVIDYYEKSDGQNLLGNFDTIQQAESFGQAIHEAHEFFFNSEDGFFSIAETVPREFINNLADYMNDNKIDLSIFTPDDLINIEGFSDFDSEIQEAIARDVTEYAKLGEAINNNRKAEQLYAEEANRVYLQMKGIIPEDGKMSVQSIITERIFSNEGGINVSDEEIDKKVTDLFFKPEEEQKVLEESIKQYNKKYDTTLKEKFWGGYDVYTKDEYGNDKKVSKISEEDLLRQYLKDQMMEEAAKNAQEQGEKGAQIITDFANQFDNADKIAEILSLSTNKTETTDVDSEVDLSQIITQQQAKDLSENWDEMITKMGENNDFLQVWGYSQEDLTKAQQKLKESIDKRANMTDAQALGSEGIKLLNQTADTVMSQSIKGELTPDKTSAEYDALINKLESIRDTYPDLISQIETFSNKNLIGTDEWKNSLYDIQIALSNLDIEEKVEEWDNSIKDFQKDGKFNIDIDDEEFNNKMDDILDKDYSVTVAVEAQMDDEFNQVFDGINDIDNAVNKIQEGWKVSKNDIVELGEMIPGIAENYRITADGMVQLDEQTAKSAINAAQVRMEASKQETIKDLENAAKSYNAKADAYDMMAIAAQKAADNEIDASEAVSTINAQLDKVDEENSNLKAINEQENSSDTVEVGIKNTQTLMDADAQWAKQAIENAKAVAKAKSAAMAGDEAGANQSVTQGTVSGSGAGTKTINETDIEEEKSKAAAAQSKEDWQKLAAQYQAMADQNRKAGSKMLAEAAALKAASNDLTYDKGHAGDKKGGSKGKDKSEKEAKQEDLIEDEKDRYHDVNIELEQISETLNRLQKQQDKLVGKNLIDNLNKQLGQLNKQIETTKEKIKIAKGEASELKDKLSGYGVTFNADGTIGNYAAAYQAQLAYVNGIIASYNAMSAEAQEAYKDTVDNAKENFNKFKDLISKYDDLIVDTIPGLEDDIQDAIDKEVEIQITKFNMEIEIRLNMAEAERDWNAFKKKVIDGIKDTDILGNAKASLQDFFSYYKENGKGIIQVNTQHVEDVLNELKQMDATGSSNVYGDNRNAALEDLKKYNDQLMSDLESMVDLVDEIKKSYLDMMDEASEKLNEQLDMYEHISDLIEHDMNVIQLVYGEESYSQLSTYYQKQEENFNRQLDFQRQQVDFWQQQMDTLEKGSDEWKKAKEEWLNAVKEWNSTVESAIKNLQDKYLNAIHEIFQELNNEVTSGMGLSYVGEQWELINRNADQYLDTINSIYSVQQLQKKYQDAIDNTDSLSQQRKLNQLMTEEIRALEEKDKLTQYDIDRAELKYQIALKQVALEEAQQNKSTMRLRRDTQGNYSYQYVADEDQVASIRDEISNLYNQLYNMDIDRYRDNLDQIYSVWEEFQEKMMEAAQINDPEEREQRELLLKEQYGELINGLVEQNETVRTNLYESSFLELKDLYQENSINFENMTQDESDLVKKVVEGTLEDFMSLSDAEKELVMRDMIPQWNSGVQQMANTFAGRGGLVEVCKNAFDRIGNATQEYKQDLAELQHSAGQNFNEISKGIDYTIDDTQKLLSNNKELINSYQQELQAVRNIIEELNKLIAKYKNAEDAAKAAATAAYNYWNAEQEKAAKAAEEDQKTNTSVVNNVETKPEPEVTPQPVKTGGDGIAAVGDVATLSGKYYYDSYGTKPAGSKYSGVANGVVIDKINNNPYGIHIHSADGKYGDLGWVKKSQLSGYDTGGYTGDWGDNSGKLALLHKKELVLNAGDTENMLNMLEIMRGITSTMDSNMLLRMANMLSGVSNTSINPGIGNDTLEQNVHIEASFPNVTQSKEIENAIHNLNNIASQRINRKR